MRLPPPPVVVPKLYLQSQHGEDDFVLEGSTGSIDIVVYETPENRTAPVLTWTEPQSMQHIHAKSDQGNAELVVEER